MSDLNECLLNCNGCLIHQVPKISIIPVKTSTVLECDEACSCATCRALFCHNYAARSAHYLKTSDSNVKPDLKSIRVKYTSTLPKFKQPSLRKEYLHLKYNQRLSYVELLIRDNTDSRGYVTLVDNLVSNLMEAVNECLSRITRL